MSFISEISDDYIRISMPEGYAPYSPEQIAENLPSIGFGFTCRKCGKMTDELKAAVDHQMANNCQKLDAATGIRISTLSDGQDIMGEKRALDDTDCKLPIKRAKLLNQSPPISTRGRATRLSTGVIEKASVLEVLGKRDKKAIQPEEVALEDDDDKAVISTVLNVEHDEETVIAAEVVNNDDVDVGSSQSPNVDFESPQIQVDGAHQEIASSMAVTSQPNSLLRQTFESAPVIVTVGTEGEIPEQFVEDINEYEIADEAEGRRYHLKKGEFRCNLCKMRNFATQEELDMHVSFHSPIAEEYSCGLCEEKQPLKHWSRFLMHLMKHEEYQQQFSHLPVVKKLFGNFACSKCGKSFYRVYALRSHMRTMHSSEPKSCPYCAIDLSEKDEKTVQRHLEKCRGQVHQCQDCSYSSTVLANLQSHALVHTDKAQICDICEKVFPTLSRLRQHRVIHDPDRRKVSCELCGQEFFSNDAVVKHKIRVHTEVDQLYRCGCCSYTAKLEGDLYRHMLIHDKDLKCDKCPYQTNSKHAWEQHQNYHNADRRFACGYQDCHYRGSNSKQLSSHVANVHRNSTRHQCPVCLNHFKKKVHLARHLVSHTGGKPYSCQTCGEAFGSHSSYYRHRNKFGHDAGREGVASIPTNITIQYVPPDERENRIEKVDDFLLSKTDIEGLSDNQHEEAVVAGDNSNYIIQMANRDDLPADLEQLVAQGAQVVLGNAADSESEGHAVGERIVFVESDGTLVPMQSEVVLEHAQQQGLTVVEEAEPEAAMVMLQLQSGATN